jgi:hypothetical protein
MAEFPARAPEISAWSSSARDDGVPELGARSGGGGTNRSTPADLF